MKKPGSVRSLAAAAAALSLVTSSVASAAPAFANAAPAVASPLVTLSVFGTSGSRAALCAASSAALAGAASTAAVQPAQGCVLPAVDAPPPVVVSEVPPPAAPYAVAEPGMNIWPLLASLAAFSAVFFLLDDAILGDDDDFDLDLPTPDRTPPGSPT